MKEHSVKLNILKELADGAFHSGEVLGQNNQISRAAVAKHIKGLQSWGIDIFSVQRKGYRLAAPLELLDEKKLNQNLSTPVDVIPVIDSTNQYLIDRTESLQSGHVCVAEYQQAGRGRRGRTWVSPFGSNLYLSMYWRLEAGMAAAMGLSLVVGVSIVEALESLGIHGVKLKWPNDLYYNDRKLAGILVEMSGQAGGAAHLVIGMGLNISMSDKVEGITQPWVALNQVSNWKNLSRNQLVEALVTHLFTSLSEYELKGMNGLPEKWQKLDNFYGRPIKLLMGQKEVQGICRGIDQQGAVLLETPNGIEPYIGGEISLRPNE